MDVLITLTGVQHVGGDTDKVELKTDGTFTAADDRYTLAYDESAATGMAGTHTMLRIEKDKVSLERTGASAGLLVMEHGKRHLCNYGTPYGSLMLGVFTDTLHRRLTQNGGTLDVSYTLDADGSMLSKQELHITVTPKTD